jgi:hypothetical protein
MRRSLCTCEPHYALAGDLGTWKFVYTPATALPKGTKLRFDLHSEGRPSDWEIPQTDLKEKGNLIWAEPFNQKPLVAKSVGSSSFEFVLPIDLKATEPFSIFIGTPDKNGTKKGNGCQKVTQRRRPFHLYIDTKGKGDYKEFEIFALDVRGNTLKNLKVVAPSLVSRNKRFDVIVRFEDIYGNLTSNAPSQTLIDLSYEHLRENLNWKLFVPETGFIALPNLYFNEAGLYRIQLRDLHSQETYFSSPIKCLPESGIGIYWGLLHGESNRFDSLENIENFLRHMRDDRSLQFIATSCFDSEEETPNEVWRQINQQIGEFNEDDRFVALLGFQWLGEPKQEGLRHFIHTKDSKPLLRRKDSKHNSLKKIYKTHNPKDLIAIPSFTMGPATLYDFEDFNPEYERVVEIYNGWGSSECSAKEGNARPIKGGRKGVSGDNEGSLQKALNGGHRFGFVAGGYDDRGPYASFYDTDQTQYSAGLTAILAKEHTRSSLIDALQRRSCYATTGEKIILGLHIANHPMGSEIDVKARPGLEFNRHITGYAIGTKPLSEVTLVRNGKDWKKVPHNGEKAEFEIDDQELLSEIILEPNKEEQFLFVYYYLRVVQEDGAIAWSSPIWVQNSAAVKARSRKK